MNQKTLDIVLSILAVFITLRMTKHITIPGGWFVTEVIRIVLCIIALIFVSAILHLIVKKKSS
ncbi:hypothetical protein P4629_26405 [Priestia aryabhattai]|uniref:hypothetical protein n=1 Tax=Priestia TaxID=2800373 RepID=UPI000BF92393|nr:hypothetical protein [Priestia aryabhattai]MED4008913.1 hypothetical protein [Priestia aryabhattai]PGA17712.1 hypothetical protein COL65_15070 [Priestia aryabhattai]